MHPGRNENDRGPKVRTDGDDRRNRKGRRGKDSREKVVEELTPEEEAALKAEKEAEARQMTIDEWNAKKANTDDNELKEELKEARKVDREGFEKLQQVERKQIEAEWGASGSNKKQNGKKQQNKKKEVVPIGAGPGHRGGKREGQRDREKKGKGERNPQLKLDDQTLFPSLGAKK